jgi:hypothetical protein
MSEPRHLDAFAHLEAARRHFDAGDFASARDESIRFSSYRYSFVGLVEHDGFRWRRNCVCIIAHQPSKLTEHLLSAIADLCHHDDVCFLLISNGPDDLFPYADRIVEGRYASMVAGFNMGASAGRNAAIEHARSDNLIFLDDDGLTTSDDVRRLIETRDLYDATAVRGRILKRNPATPDAKHYNLGDHMRQRFIDIEGMAIWKRDALASERFDPLLYGHEGLELTTRLFAGHGPDAFLYEPRAMMRHDFAADEAALAGKRQRMDACSRYIDFLGGHRAAIAEIFKEDGRSLYSFARLDTRRQAVNAAQRHAAAPMLTVIATCPEQDIDVADFCAGLLSQSSKNFKLLLADEGKSDRNRAAVVDTLGGRITTSSLRDEFSSRGEALEAAIAAVDTEYAAIFNLSHRSLPQRVAWTASLLWESNDVDAISLELFDEVAGSRVPTPFPLARRTIELSRIMGGALHMDALAFKTDAVRRLAPLASQPHLALFRQFSLADLRGIYLPLLVACSPARPDTRADPLVQLSLSYARESYARLAGGRMPKDATSLDLLFGQKAVKSGKDLAFVRACIEAVLANIATAGSEMSDDIVVDLSRLFDQRRIEMLLQEQKRARRKADAGRRSTEQGPVD